MTWRTWSPVGSTSSSNASFDEVSALTPLLLWTKSSIARPIGWSAGLVNVRGDHGLWLPPLEVPIPAG
jgi:hypothetical protein